MEEILKDFGLPTALLLFFIREYYRISKEYNEYIKEVATKSVLSLDNNTAALESNTEQSQRVETALQKASKLVEEASSAKG